MDLVFSLSTRKKVLVLRDLDRVSGFLIGLEAGETLIIDDLWNLELNSSNLSYYYPQLLSNFGNSLLGVFISGENYFLNEWFLGGFILELEKNSGVVYRVDFNQDEGLKKKIIWRDEHGILL
jgi:hypothetical protein